MAGSPMTKICIVEKKQVVVLKKEIYVEGTKEEIEVWMEENQFNDSNYKWRETVEYVQSDSETVEVMVIPEQDEFNFLRFIHKPEIYNLAKDNNRSVSSKHGST
mgnify:CR=1 FL=1|tara:strand:+ start:239 stop:550 length:312 start_codon:yes stop_codon:yes gene_type:complete